MSEATVIQPSEAGFSTNLFLNHPAMGKVQFTFRGATSQDWGSVLEDLDRFLHYMKEKGWTFEGKPQQPAPETQTEAPVPPAPKLAGETSNVNIMHIAKMTVEPKADGKIKIGLFGDNHKFADLFMTKGLDATLQTLAPVGGWTAEHLSRVSEYNVDFSAEWKNSTNLNSKGNPYKDVVALRPNA